MKINKKTFLRASLAFPVLCWFNIFGGSTVMADAISSITSTNTNALTVTTENGVATITPVTGNVGKENSNLVTGQDVYSYLHQRTVAIGEGSSAKDKYATAVGIYSKANDFASTAFGFCNTASGIYAMAAGFYSSTDAEGAVAVGTVNKASGNYSSAVGVYNTATGNRASAIGYDNKASGDYSSAIGFKSYTGAKCATAIGYRAVSTETGTVSFGHKRGDPLGYEDGTYDSDNFARLTNIAEGKDDNDAVNVKQLKEFVNEKLDNGMSDLEGQINKVSAGAAALAALHPEAFNPDDKWSFAVGYGHYKNANAGALGTFYKPNADTTVSLGSTIGNGDAMMNVGVSFKLGHRGENFASNASNAELAAEVNRLRNENAQMKADNEQIRTENAQMKAQIAQIMKKLALSDKV